LKVKIKSFKLEKKPKPRREQSLELKEKHQIVLLRKMSLNLCIKRNIKSIIIIRNTRRNKLMMIKKSHCRNKIRNLRLLKKLVKLTEPLILSHQTMRRS